VSLHSHTLQSRESLDFIGRATANTPWLAGAIRKQTDKYRALKGRDLDLRRAWWTPPLSPLHAWKLEKSQIEQSLDLGAFVSLTDHDNIHAGQQLSMLDETRACPISVEWTAPWRQTFFHLGLHNLPAQEATSLMSDLEAITASPVEANIAAILDRLNAMPEILIVMNHPLWDENHIGAGPHRECFNSFFALCGPFVHALELNGLRPWKENRDVMELAEAVGLPAISGGDRHGREPNACINLTNAAAFAEFVEEVRRDGWSDVLFMPQYREPFRLRILQNLCDIIEDDPNHSLGWTHWNDRVFYLTDEGIDKSLHEMWGTKIPSVVTRFVSLMALVRHRRVRSALRFALAQRDERIPDTVS
jgi:hypothetical protein